MHAFVWVFTSLRCAVTYFGNSVLTYSFHFALRPLSHVVKLIIAFTVIRAASLLLTTQALIPPGPSETDELSNFLSRLTVVSGSLHPGFVLPSPCTFSFRESPPLLTLLSRPGLSLCTILSNTNDDENSLSASFLTTLHHAASFAASFLERALKLGVLCACTHFFWIYELLLSSKSAPISRVWTFFFAMPVGDSKTDPWSSTGFRLLAQHSATTTNDTGQLHPPRCHCL